MKKENTENLTLKERRDKFLSLNIKYNMDTFEFCADNNIDLDVLRKFTPANLIMLVRAGIDGHKKEDAYKIIDEWRACGYSLPLLHIFCLTHAQENGGFFMQVQDLNNIPQMISSQDELTLILPTVEQDIAGVSTLIPYLKKSTNI